jgi:hypothetical protein
MEQNNIFPFGMAVFEVNDNKFEWYNSYLNFGFDPRLLKYIKMSLLIKLLLVFRKVLIDVQWLPIQ